MKIPLVDLVTQYHSIKAEMDQAVLGVLESGRFILGPNVSSLEEEVADYLGVQHAIGVASGTDALVLTLRAFDIGPGDEVIVPAYSFFATAGTVMTVGAQPVFVDVHPETYLIDLEALEAAITPRTKAIIPVHLYGQPAEKGLNYRPEDQRLGAGDSGPALGHTKGGRVRLDQQRPHHRRDLRCLSPRCGPNRQAERLAQDRRDLRLRPMLF